MVATIFDVLFEGLISVFGVTFFIPLLILSVIIILSLRYGVSMLPIGALFFTGIIMFSTMKYTSIPFLDDYFVILMMLLFGVVLGIMFFIFWVRR